MESSFNIAELRKHWHPIASVSDLVYRHVYHAQILGRELALWRADDDHINVWENRCLHRGVRLSIGINDGSELVCQYHGWRYANRTAGCTYIPAHPADAPARSICNNVYPAKVSHGLLWSGEEPAEPLPDFPELYSGCKADNPLALRPVSVNATLTLVADALNECNEQLAGISRVAWQPKRLTSTQFAFYDNEQCALLMLLQPVDSDRTILRGLLASHQCHSDELSVLRKFSRFSNFIRDNAEQRAASREAPPRILVPIKPVSSELAQMPPRTAQHRSAPLRVSVDTIETIAHGIKRIVLAPLDISLPTFHPGAHIDVHLPGGLIRQYSLTNAPGQTDRFIIGVKLDNNSMGGSAYIHEHLKEGDVLATSEPRNNFPLRRDAVYTRLIAGGIGITPLISMARAMAHTGQNFSLDYFVKHQREVAFKSILTDLEDRVTIHQSPGHRQTESLLSRVLSDYQPNTHCYICGPSALLDIARSLAQAGDWPDEAVHFEYFKNTLDRSTDQAFQVSLARSGLTLQVPAGKTLLAVLRENGIPVPSSCEQGACGTCQVAVLDGTPEHQDVYLSKTEQQRGDCMMSCVSRALTSSLTLDI